MMCGYPNSTPKPTRGSRIQGVEEQKCTKADVAAVARRLTARWLSVGTEGQFFVLLCPWGRWLCQSSKVLVPQFPLVGGKRLRVLHGIQPPGFTPWFTTWPQQWRAPPKLFLELTPTVYGFHLQPFYHNIRYFIYLLTWLGWSVSIRRCVSARGKMGGPCRAGVRCGVKRAVGGTGLLQQIVGINTPNQHMGAVSPQELILRLNRPGKHLHSTTISFYPLRIRHGQVKGCLQDSPVLLNAPTACSLWQQRAAFCSEQIPLPFRGKTMNKCSQNGSRSFTHLQNQYVLRFKEDHHLQES